MRLEIEAEFKDFDVAMKEVIKDSKKYSGYSAADLVAAVGKDVKKLKRHAEYINQLMADFREKYPKRVGNFPKEDELTVPEGLLKYM